MKDQMTMAPRHETMSDNIKSPLMKYIMSYIANYGGRLQSGETSSVVFPPLASKRMTIGLDLDARVPFIGVQAYEGTIFDEYPLKEAVFMRQAQTKDGPTDFLILAFADASRGQGVSRNGEPKEFPLHFWYPVQDGIFDHMGFVDEDLKIQLVKMDVAPNGSRSYPENESVLAEIPLIRAGNWEGVELRTLTKSKEIEPGHGLPPVQSLSTAIIGDDPEAEIQTTRELDEQNEKKGTPKNEMPDLSVAEPPEGMELEALEEGKPENLDDLLRDMPV